MIELESVDSIDSTSDALQRRLAAGEPGEAALLAREQTGGRGRLGRRWETIDGNLHLSLLLRPGPLPAPGHWSLLTAVALADTAAAFLPDPAALRLKWPNDLLLGGGKLAGILLEAGDDGAPWLLIGCGVNLAGAPQGLGRATAAMPPPPPEPVAFARALLEALQAWRLRYRTDGFEPVRQAWLARGPVLGAPVTVSGGGGLIAGSFAGIADNGGLCLQGDDGPHVVVAGEVA